MMLRTELAGKLAISIVLASVCAGGVVGQEQDQSEKQNPSEKQTQGQSSGRTQSGNQEEITAVPNRPTLATMAETVQHGVFEIEYGFEAAKAHQNINGLLKWGMFKNLELWFLNNPIQRDAGIAGMGDSGAGFKYRIVSQAKALPTISILYFATLPTAIAGLGAGAVGHSVQILLSKDFGKHHFDFNYGPQFLGRPGASGFDRNYFSALSYSYALTKKWGYTGEVAGFSRANPTTPATMTLLNAATYNVSPRLVLDCGVFVAVYGHLPRVNFIGGVTYSIADLYHLHSSRRSAKN
ncbi:MAG TPA: hypothetical protein VHF01_05445 [Candidatus Acidoferrum sp.]|nr:hypothetical protein [Candidatus Acidoferrum sp.]